MKERILIGVPTYEGKEYCLDYWIKKLKEIVKKAKTKFLVDVLIVDNSKGLRYKRLLSKSGFRIIHVNRTKDSLESLFLARKIIFDETRKGKYDFLFSLEQDVFPPIDIINTLVRLRKRIKDPLAIVGAPYIQDSGLKIIKGERLEREHLTSIADKRFWHKKYKTLIQHLLFASKLPKKELMKCYAVGFGCTLVDKNVLKKVPHEFFKGEGKPDDSYFYLNCLKKKIPVYSANKLLGKVRHFKGSILSEESWWVLKKH